VEADFIDQVQEIKRDRLQHEPIDLGDRRCIVRRGGVGRVPLAVSPAPPNFFLVDFWVFDASATKADPFIYSEGNRAYIDTAEAEFGRGLRSVNTRRPLITIDSPGGNGMTF
jgi:hypothetical protein